MNLKPISGFAAQIVSRGLWVPEFVLRDYLSFGTTMLPRKSISGYPVTDYQKIKKGEKGK